MGYTHTNGNKSSHKKNVVRLYSGNPLQVSRLKKGYLALRILPLINYGTHLIFIHTINTPLSNHEWVSIIEVFNYCTKY